MTTHSPLRSPARPPLRVAHRGMPRRLPENTLEGFALAIECGADGLELDVHATADGEIVIHHDNHLASGEAIDMLTRRDLDAMAVRGAARLPTLSQLCDLVRAKVELFIELKGAGVERLIEQALGEYAGALALHSFDHHAIEWLHRNGSTRRLGILLEHQVEDAEALMQRTGALDVWPRHDLVSTELVNVVHQRGGRVIPWTVNEADDIARVMACGVDGICTDDVTLIPSR